MKTNKFFALAAIACGFALSFTSCSKEDNPAPVPAKQTVTIGFENATLNNLGFWCGEVNDNGVDNGWGGMAYPCIYKEAGAEFNTTFSGYYWSGYAISNRTETGFSFGDGSYSPEGMPDQFNNVTGKAHGGNNFCIVQTYGESIEFGTAVTIKGFWYTNSSYTADAYVNGDGMSPGKFEADDWFKCVLYPTPAEGLGGARYELYLAKDGDYVKEWKYCDLSDVDAFKNIKSVSFNFEGTKANDWGVTTPAYICIDDVVVEK
jgi:hypothetical protein